MKIPLSVLRTNALIAESSKCSSTKVVVKKQMPIYRNTPRDSQRIPESNVFKEARTG
jgi:hypothetical protein